MKQVREQSPDLQIEKATVEESKAKASGIRIDPPMIGYMTMSQGDSKTQGFEISQEIPFPTKIAKEKRVRELEAQAQSVGSKYRQNEILVEARRAYIDFWRVYEKEKIVFERKEWLRKHAQIVRSTIRSDSGAQAHYLGIESEVDLLENEVLEIRSDVIQKRNQLKVFAPKLEITEVAPKEPKIESIDVDQNLSSNLVSWKQNEVSAAEAERSFKKQAAIPDLYVRYRSFNANQMTPRNEEVMIGITVPFLFFWQPQAESAGASAKYQRAQAELQKVRIELDSNLKSLLQKADAQRTQLETLNEKLIPRAHKRMNIIENLSKRTMEGLDEHRTVMLDYLDLRSKALDVRAEYEATVSKVLKLINKEAAP